MVETLLSTSEVLLFGRELRDIGFIKDEHPGVEKGRGFNKFLAAQLMDGDDNDPRLARIYGFSFEGSFQELPSPAVFLVHGEGVNATQIMDSTESGATIQNAPGQLASRAPNNPDLSGVASADFQIADDIRVWFYDKGDYSIRMDVMTGQLEQILLDQYFEVEVPLISGGKVAGGKVSGGKVLGNRIAGGKVRGGKVSGSGD